ncbi:MAG: hypothetical protein RLZZ543_1553 [Bacteroidota bacterium]|jgi:NadR type nicotinamide-nucleotide adenylyltransferase
MIKIAITGPESTGKSTLAQQLSEHYSCPMVPEYAREYLQELNRKYRAYDVEAIARGQMDAEKILDKPLRLLFCDTDLLVCRIWLEVVFGSCPDWLLNASRMPRYTHTLLMNIDLPWEPDPLREHPTRRKELFDRYQKALKEDRRPFTLISGTDAERLQNAIQVIDGLLKAEA